MKSKTSNQHGAGQNQGKDRTRCSFFIEKLYSSRESTTEKCVTPESNHTSSVSSTFSYLVPQHPSVQQHLHPTKLECLFFQASLLFNKCWAIWVKFWCFSFFYEQTEQLAHSQHVDEKRYTASGDLLSVPLDTVFETILASIQHFSLTLVLLHVGQLDP